MNNDAPTYSEGPASPAQPLVTVVDDDESVRESLPDLLKELGFAVSTFSSALDFLESGNLSKTRCLILDVAMPGMTGPELHLQLKSRGENIPVVFVTARGDATLRRQLIAQGAVDCLFKPFTEQQLRAALDTALGR
jgi:FixJ family two-component response regulator